VKYRVSQVLEVVEQARHSKSFCRVYTTRGRIHVYTYTHVRRKEKEDSITLAFQSLGCVVKTFSRSKCYHDKFKQIVTFVTYICTYVNGRLNYVCMYLYQESLARPNNFLGHDHHESRRLAGSVCEQQRADSSPNRCRLCQTGRASSLCRCKHAWSVV